MSLAKPGITGMVLFTTAVGYAAASGTAVQLFLMMLLGTALASAGASTLNMVLEHRTDARMRRTADRPIPAGRVGVNEGLVLGTLLSITGIGVLALLANALAGALAALTIGIYVFVYTPLKNWTCLSAIAGTVAGAIPPMIGWAAVTGRLETGAWMFFLVTFVWQWPHVLSIAWIYREDYASAGFPTLTVGDTTGAATGRRLVLQSTALLIASVFPFIAGVARPVYLAASLTLGATMLVLAIQFSFRPSRLAARRVFLASLVYLPIVLALLAYNGQPLADRFRSIGELF